MLVSNYFCTELLAVCSFLFSLTCPLQHWLKLCPEGCWDQDAAIISLEFTDQYISSKDYTALTLAALDKFILMGYNYLLGEKPMFQEPT